METDQTELNDVSDLNANLVLELKQKYDEWAADAGVLPWEEVIKLGNN
ncbi:hypothetical protein [Pleomorphovibrio marinus]|nr:hypothetical protein [Pleomorphovibrio marinus]